MAGSMNNGHLQLDRYGYKFKGQRFQRVTTIKGMVNTGGALLDWAARCVAQKAQGFATDFRDGKIDRDSLIVSLLDESLCKAHNDAREGAADFGTIFHQLVEDWALGKSDALDKLPRDDPDMWQRAEHFADWCDKYKPDWVKNEFTVFNRQHSYAGTCDAIAQVGNCLVMIDVKTSKAVYSEYALQMAAYRYAEFIGHADGRETEVPKVDCCAVLLARPEGCRLVEIECGPVQFEAFLACHKLYWWKRNQPDAVDFQPRLQLAQGTQDAVAGAVAQEVRNAVFA